MPELNAADKKLGRAAPPSDAAAKGAGYKVKVDREKCKGCRLCVFYCPARHLALSSDLDRRGLPFVTVQPQTRCTGCGACFLMCPDSCIEVHGED